MHTTINVFNQAFFHSPIGMAFVSLEGKWIEVNPSFCKITGYHEEELLSTTFQNITYLDDREIDLDELKSLIDGKRESYEMEKRYIHKEGHIVWVLLTISIVREGEEQFFIAQIQDISERKHIEQAVKESEKKYRDLVELSPDAIIVHQKNKIVYINPAGIQLFKANDEKQMIGRSILDIVHPSDHKIVKERIRQSYEGRIKGDLFQEKFMTLDGQTIHVEVLTSCGTHDGKPATQVIVRDITERIALEEELKISYERLQHVLIAAKIGTAVVDMKEGRLLETDAVLQEIMGYKEEELRNRPFSEITYPDDNELNLELYRELLEGKLDHYHLEKRYIRKDGQAIWGDLTVAILSQPSRTIMAIVQDITERKELEQQLQLYSKVIQTTQQGVTITAQDGNIVWVNDSFTRMTGYSIEEVIGQNPRKLKSGKHDKSFYQKMWLSIRDTGHWQGEIWNKSKNGNIYPELLTISSLKNEKGEVTNYIAVFTDITLLKEVEQQLHVKNDVLKRLASMDGLTQIPNRRSFDEYLEREWNKAVLHHSSFSLVMLDLDYFKIYNDTYGHQSGDDCLKKVAGVLKEYVTRSSDLPARYGGEEFAVILPDTDAKGAVKVAEDLRRLIESLRIPHEGSKINSYVTVSIGVSTIIPEAEKTPDDLIRGADQALYHAKMLGRNRVVTL